VGVDWIDFQCLQPCQLFMRPLAATVSVPNEMANF
jgi:hypothetical protein